MIKLDGDPGRNRIDLLVAGRPAPDELDALIERVEAVLASLAPGYTAAIDIAEMDTLQPLDVARVARVQASLVAADPGRIGTLVRPGLERVQIATVGVATGIDGLARRFTDRAEWEAYTA